MAEKEKREQKEQTEPVKKSGFLRRFLALLLGFLLGVIATLGGIVGVGFYTYKKVPINKAASLIPGVDYSKYITEDYANGTLENLVGDLVPFLKNPSSLSLQSLLQFTPYPEKLVKQIQNLLVNYGIDVDSEEFLAVPFKEYKSYFKKVTKNIRLGSLLTSVGIDISGVLTHICYGEEGVDYDIVEGKIQMREGKEELRLNVLLEDEDGIIGVLYHVPLDVLLEVDLNDTKEDDPIMLALSYGSEGVQYAIENQNGELVVVMKEIIYTAKHDGDTHTLFDEFGREIKDAYYDNGIFVIPQEDGTTWYAVHDSSLEENEYRVYNSLEPNAEPLKFHKRTVNDLMHGAEDIMMSLRICDVLKNTSSSPMITAIKNWTIADLTDPSKIETLKIGDLIPVGSSDSPILNALKDYTIADLKTADVIDSLKLGDLMVIDSSSSQVLQALKGYTIGDLKKEETLNSLKLGDLMVIDSSSSQVLQALKGYTLGDLKKEDTINSLKLSDLMKIDESSSLVLQALKDYTIAQLKTEGALDSLKLGQLIKIDETSSAVLQALKDYTIAQLKTEGTLDNLTLGELITIDSTSSPVLQALKGYTIAQLKQENTINSLKLGDLMKIDETSSLVLQALKDYTIAQLKQEGTMDGLKLGQLIKIDSSSSQVLQALQGYTIAQLKAEGTLDGLQLGQLIKIDGSSSQVLQALQGYTIAQLKTEGTMDGLKLGQLIKIDSSSSKVLQALQNYSISDLKKEGLIDSLTLSQLVKIDGDSSKILQALQNYTIAQLKQETTVNGLKLSDIISIDSNSSKIMQAMANWSISDLKDQSKIEELYISDLINLGSGSSGLLNAIAGWQIKDLNNRDKLNSVRIDQIIPVTENSPHMLRSLLTYTDENGDTQYTTIGTLETRLHSLKLADVLADDSDNSNVIIQKLGDTPIEDLSDRIATLSIQELYANDVFEGKYVDQKYYYYDTLTGNYISQDDLGFITYELMVDGEKHVHFMHFDKPIEKIIAEANAADPSLNLTKETFNVNATYAQAHEVLLVLKGEWKYLLHPIGHPTVETHAFMLTDTTSLVDNMMANIKSTDLEQLNEDFEMGMSESLLNTALNQRVIQEANKTTERINPDGKTHIRDLTIQELTIYIEVILGNPLLLYGS